MGWGISMQYCRFCGAEAPTDARFCGYCGRTLTGQKDVDATIRSGGAQAGMAQPPQQPEEYQSGGQTVRAFGHPPLPPTAPVPYYEPQQSHRSGSWRSASQAQGFAARLMAGRTAKLVLLLVIVIMVLVISGIGV